MRKLFQFKPLIEIEECQHFKFIGNYEFLEASSNHCKFLYQNLFITIKGKSIHIDLLKNEELIIRVEHLSNFEMIESGEEK